MKSLFTIFATLLAASLANAEIKPPGTFVANLCSPVAEPNVISVNPISEICLGQIVGTNAMAFSIQRLYSKSQIFLVQTEESLPQETAKHYRVKYYLVTPNGQGAGAMIATVDTSSNQLLKLESDEKSAITWVAENFEMVFTTQGTPLKVPIVF